MVATVAFLHGIFLVASGLAEATDADAAMLCSVLVNLLNVRTDRLGCFMQLVCLPLRSLVSTCNLLIPEVSSCSFSIPEFQRAVVARCCDRANVSRLTLVMTRATNSSRISPRESTLAPRKRPRFPPILPETKISSEKKWCPHSSFVLLSFYGHTFSFLCDSFFFFIFSVLKWLSAVDGTLKSKNELTSASSSPNKL